MIEFSKIVEMFIFIVTSAIGILVWARLWLEGWCLVADHVDYGQGIYELKNRTWKVAIKETSLGVLCLLICVAMPLAFIFFWSYYSS